MANPNVIIELETGVWLANGEQIAPTTTDGTQARKFKTNKDALKALSEIFKTESFPKAIITPVIHVEPQ